MISTKTNHCKLAALTLVLIAFQAAHLQAAELDCLVKPEMYVELSTPAEGVIENFLVNKGDHVSKGETIVQLEASVEIARVNQAKFAVANTTDFTNRKVRLAFAKRTQARYRGLKHENSMSQLEKDKADTEVSLAEIELKKAVDDHKAAELTLALAKAQLAQKTIKSPIDGIVIDRFAAVGESVKDRAIMKLAQVNPLRVELVAPTEYFGLIKKGMEVEIRPERPANKVYKAHVTVVDQLIDPASGSFAVRMALPNPADEMIGGVNCLAIFNFETPAISSLSKDNAKSADGEASQPAVSGEDTAPE